MLMVNPFNKDECQGCQDRAEIMGAGSWEQDATVIFILLFLSAVIIFMLKCGG